MDGWVDARGFSGPVIDFVYGSLTMVRRFVLLSANLMKRLDWYSGVSVNIGN